jgi:nucleosome-remodeling factor subunit BPTF
VESKPNGLGRGRAKVRGNANGSKKAKLVPEASKTKKPAPRKSKVEKTDSDGEDMDMHIDFFSEEEEPDAQPASGLDSDESDDELLATSAPSDDEDNISEVESVFSGLTTRSPTPLPVWLQDRPDLPRLDLPPSSDDLLISRDLVMKVLPVYETLIRFRRVFRLSPFRVEDFCAALSAEEQSALLSELHIQLVKSIVRNSEALQVLFGPPDLRDVINANFYFMDTMTWPAVLKLFFDSHDKFAEARAIVAKNYPYCSPEERLRIIEILVEELMLSNAVRDEMANTDGKIAHEDHCRSCHALGELLCCCSCPAVYHVACTNLTEEPDYAWPCFVCVAEKVRRIFSNQHKFFIPIARVYATLNFVKIEIRFVISQRPSIVTND